jgi:hypothetical protein
MPTEDSEETGWNRTFGAPTCSTDDARTEPPDLNSTFGYRLDVRVAAQVEDAKNCFKAWREVGSPDSARHPPLAQSTTRGESARHPSADISESR